MGGLGLTTDLQSYPVENKKKWSNLKKKCLAHESYDATVMVFYCFALFEMLFMLFRFLSQGSHQIGTITHTFNEI